MLVAAPAFATLDLGEYVAIGAGAAFPSFGDDRSAESQVEGPLCQ
jgi:hypothetical protein